MDLFSETKLETKKHQSQTIKDTMYFLHFLLLKTLTEEESLEGPMLQTVSQIFNPSALRFLYIFFCQGHFLWLM